MYASLGLSGAADHVRDAVARSGVTTAPFPHLMVQNVLPDALFQRLIVDLPNPGDLQPMKRTGWKSVSAYDRRGSCLVRELTARVDAPAWTEVEQSLTDSRVEAALRHAFEPWIDEARKRRLNTPLYKEVRIDCDRAGSFLHPHTDAPSAFVKSIIYMWPPVLDPSLDTLLYVPVDPDARARALFDGSGDFTDDGYHHERIEDHRVAARVAFRPNCMLSFLRTRDTLHGLEAIAASAAPRFLLSLHFRYARAS